MKISGIVKDFRPSAEGMHLFWEDHELFLSPNSERALSLACLGLYCRACGNSIRRAFSQGHCFPCSQRLARCDLCVLQPARCHYHLGTCREPAWGEQHCMQEHLLYLSWTSECKVGITRASRLEQRLYEQGALLGSALTKTQTRHQAGLLEAHLSQYYKDRTSWKRMLLEEEACAMTLASLHAEAQEKLLAYDPSITCLPYEPIKLTYPKIPFFTIQTERLKLPIQQKLMGSKGHYLLFEHGVLSVRTLLGQHIDCRLL